VRLAPFDLDPAQLADALLDGWEVHATALEYVAIGGGSHHWRGTTSDGERLWLSVDDLQDKPFLGSAPSVVQAELQRALQVARALHDDACLEFVVAPIPTRGGEMLRPLGKRYALAVYPFLDGETFAFGQALPPVEWQQLLDMLKRLRASTPAVGPLARRVRVEVDNRDALTDALRGARSFPAGGRLSKTAKAASEAAETAKAGETATAAHTLLAAHATAVERVLADFDRLAHAVSIRAAPLVISHGEPHPGNVLACDGRLLLLDWDTVGLAPPERDLWWLASGDAADAFADYSTATGVRVDPAALRLYRLRWLLDDLVYCVRTLWTADAITRETEHAMDELVKFVAQAETFANQDG
jgi:spectinomycin phosphotransferase